MAIQLNIDMNQVAVFGYSLLLIFAIYMLSKTKINPIDLVANIFLIIGLGSLITYHVNIIRYNITETNSKLQKSVRIVAHATIVAFFLITLLPSTKSIYRFYDNFGLVGHIYLLAAVSTSSTQLPGVIALAFYFLFASMNLYDNPMQVVGRILMLIYFGVNSITMSKAALNK